VCIAGKLRLLNRVVTSIYDDALRPTGMTICQMTLLTVIGESGLTTPTEVSACLQVEKSTLSRNLNRLRKQGWLEMLSDAHGSGQRLKLTEEGQAMLEKGKPHWIVAQGKALRLLGDRGVKDLVALAELVCSQQKNGL